MNTLMYLAGLAFVCYTVWKAYKRNRKEAIYIVTAYVALFVMIAVVALWSRANG